MTTYTTCPMSIDGASGYAVQRNHNGTVEYHGSPDDGIRLFPYLIAVEKVRVLAMMLPFISPQREWMERIGARSNSMVPMGFRSMNVAKYCTAGRHNVGYTAADIKADVTESVPILQQVNQTDKPSPLRRVSMR